MNIVIDKLPNSLRTQTSRSHVLLEIIFNLLVDITNIGHIYQVGFTTSDAQHVTDYM